MLGRTIRRPNYYEAGIATGNQIGESSPLKCLCGKDKSFREVKCKKCKKKKTLTIKDPLTFKDPLIGKRIKVKWIDSEFPYYNGIVNRVRKKSLNIKEYKIHYDDGDKRWHDLQEEEWEFIKDSIFSNLSIVLPEEQQDLESPESEFLINPEDIKNIINSYELDEHLTKKMVRKALENIMELPKGTLKNQKSLISKIVDEYIEELEANEKESNEKQSPEDQKEEVPDIDSNYYLKDARYKRLREKEISDTKAFELVKYADQNQIPNQKFRSLIQNLIIYPDLRIKVENSPVDEILNWTHNDMKNPEQIEIDKKRQDKLFQWLVLEQESQSIEEDKDNSSSDSVLLGQEEYSYNIVDPKKSSNSEEVKVCWKKDKLSESFVENNNPLNEYLQTDFSSVPLSWEEEFKINELVDELELSPFENVINKFSDKEFENNYHQRLVYNRLNPILHKIAIKRFLKKMEVIKIETRYYGILTFNWITQNKPLKLIDKNSQRLKNLNLRRWW